MQKLTKTVCDGKGLETVICVFRGEGNTCNKVNSKLPYNYCNHWKEEEREVEMEDIGIDSMEGEE